MTRSLCAWATIGFASLAYGLDFPGPVPGEARARVEGDRLILQNAVIEAAWSLADRQVELTRATNRLSGQTVRAEGTEAFALTLVDDRRIGAGQFRQAGKPSLVRLPADPKSVRRSKRFAGWRGVVPLVSTDGQLRAEWAAILRDGANYVRTELAVRATKRVVPIKKAALLQVDAPNARVVGKVNGSPVVSDTMFFACETPMGKNDVAGTRIVCAMPVYDPPGPGECWTAAAVIGVVPKGQLRRGFLYYVERERPRPYRPFLHYNSWYDIAWKDRKMNEGRCLERIERFGQDLTRKRGVNLDAFVFDDGWDDNKTLWQFHDGFPRGFTPLASAAAKSGSALGVWLSPWGGYASAKAERLKYGATQGFETNDRGFSLGGPKYYERFRSVCVRMMADYGVKYFKFDGVGKGSAPVGAGDEFGPDIEALIRLLADLRRSRPDVFLNVTAGTWPSPFWLWHSDAVWRGGRDAGHAGAGSMRQRWLTYRDMMAYQRTVQGAPLFPLSSLKSQGLCLGQLGRAYAKMSADPKDVIDEIRMMFVSGTQQQDLFITPDLMTSEMWDALAEAAAWCRHNADVLVDSHWIGGDPGKAQPYGYASWSPRLGILGLRNPSEATATFELDLQTAFELPDGAPRRYRLIGAWKRRGSTPKPIVEAGRPREFVLAPFEVAVFEAWPVRE